MKVGNLQNCIRFFYIEKMSSNISELLSLYSQPIHLTHELKLCIQITRRRVNFNGDSTAKSPCWHLNSNLSPSNPDLLRFPFYLPYRIWPFLWLHSVGLHSSDHYSGGLLCSSHQQAVQNIVQTFPEPVRLERVCCPSAWLTCFCNRPRLWFLSAAPGVPKRSTIQILSKPNAA